MTLTLVRTYTDVSGKERLLTYLENVDYLVDWHKTAPASEATRWLLDGGRDVVQIPNNAWSVLGITYKDSYGH